MKRKINIFIALLVFLITVVITPFLKDNLCATAYPGPTSSPYPPPKAPINSVITPTPTEQLPPLVQFALNIHIIGLKDSDKAELALLADTTATQYAIDKYQSPLPAITTGNGVTNFSGERLPAGSYKLVITAPDYYLREPQGYIFQISEGGEII